MWEPSPPYSWRPEGLFRAPGPQYKGAPAAQHRAEPEAKRNQRASVPLSPRRPDAAHWVVVGDDDKGGIPVWSAESCSSPKFDDRLSAGAVVEQHISSGERMCYKLREGAGPRFGWVSTSMDGMQLLVPEDEYNAHVSSPPTFTGGRWQRAPAPWKRWTGQGGGQLPDEALVFTAKGIDAFQPTAANGRRCQAGDSCTAEHVARIQSTRNGISLHGLLELGFVKVQVVEVATNIWTVSGINKLAMMADGVTVQQMGKKLEELGNPKPGDTFSLEHLSKMRQMFDYEDLSQQMLLDWEMIAPGGTRETED